MRASILSYWPIQVSEYRLRGPNGKEEQRDIGHSGWRSLDPQRVKNSEPVNKTVAAA